MIIDKVSYRKRSWTNDLKSIAGPAGDHFGFTFVPGLEGMIDPQGKNCWD
jgi:hypothetical protein